MKTLYQMCIIITLTLIVFTLAVNFVSGLDLFITNIDSGPQINQTSTNTTFTNLTDVKDPITGLSGGMDSLWKIGLGVAGFGAFALALITHSTTPIAVYLFGAVFWTSYIRSISVLSLNEYVPGSFLLIGTVAMMFIFAGAIIGMFGGSG